MEIEKFTTIIGFDDLHFSNVSYETTSEICNRNPDIEKWVARLETPTATELDLARIFLRICSELAKELKTDYEFAVTENQVAGGFRICLLDKNAIPTDESEETSLSSAHALGELTASSTNPKRDGGKPLDTELKLGQGISNLFRSQDSRPHVYGFILSGIFLRSLIFDGRSAKTSDSFDVTLNPIRFVRVLASVLTMAKEDLGYGGGDVSRMDLRHVIRDEDYIGRCRPIMYD